MRLNSRGSCMCSGVGYCLWFHIGGSWCVGGYVCSSGQGD